MVSWEYQAACTYHSCLQVGGPQRKAQISKLAFASTAKITNVVAVVNEALNTKYPLVAQKVNLYITKPKTRTSLMKPVISNILEAHEQVRTILNQIYTEAEAAAVPLQSKEDLEKALSASSD